jgi:hypothetical protein
MSMVAQVAQAMQTVLTQDAQQAAADSGLCQRASKLGGAAFTQALVFGCLGQPQPTLEDFAQAAAAGGAAVQAQAFDERFDARTGPRAADCLQRVLAAAVRQVVAADPVAVALLRRFRGVYLQDSTVVALPDALAHLFPGCGGTGRASRAAVKFQVRLDLGTGRLAGPLPEPGRAADQRTALSADDLPAGALRVADLGYFDLDAFARLGGRGVYWLSRLQEKTAVFTEAGVRVELPTWLAAQGQAVVDVAVTLGVAQRLAARLVAVRVPEAVADKRRRRLLKKARKKGKKPSAARLALCAWNVYVTNVPGGLANAAEVSVLGRARWQIELVFKLWKSDGHLDESRSGKPYRVLCEVFAKMLALVVQHWLLVAGCWREPARSLRKAAKAVRGLALGLAGTLTEAGTLRRLLEVLVQCLSAAATIAKRRQKPSTYQTLQSPTLFGVTLP